MYIYLTISNTGKPSDLREMDKLEAHNKWKYLYNMMSSALVFKDDDDDDDWKSMSMGKGAEEETERKS